MTEVNEKIQTDLERLAAEFDASAYQSRQAPGGGPELTYVSIDQTINRLNEVLGPAWSTNAKSELREVAAANGRMQFLATCELHLSCMVDGYPKTAYGVGAMQNRDPDMALKSALAEAIKKAAHQLGVGLHLWDKTTRARIEQKMTLAKASPAKLKATVYQLARDRLGKTKPTMAEVAALFNRKAADMTDDNVNREILQEEGLL